MIKRCRVAGCGGRNERSPRLVRSGEVSRSRGVEITSLGLEPRKPRRSRV